MGPAHEYHSLYCPLPVSPAGGASMATPCSSGDCGCVAMGCVPGSPGPLPFPGGEPGPSCYSGLQMNANLEIECTFAVE